MMYDEFLELANTTEDKITFRTYNDVIEPMYMGCNLSKADFVKLLNIKKIIGTYDNPFTVGKQVAENFRNDIEDAELALKLFELRMFPVSRDKGYCRFDEYSNSYVVCTDYNYFYEIKLTGKKVTIDKLY